ncbi:MAG: PKD domain-containing protein [Planctomycetota bacterium]|nr:PKD domain-containing protein [Planctomycetota bacterium]
MKTTGNVRAACAGALLTACGMATAGPADSPRGGDGWLYPAVDFQDGRARGTDGVVTRGVSDIEVATGDPEDAGPFAACFDEGYEATPEEWEAINAALADGYTSRYNAISRWPGATGAPINLTWSLAPDTVTIVGGTGGNQQNVLFSRMNQLFGSGNQNTWITQITNAMNRWATLSGVNYTRVQWSGNQWDDGAAWGSSGSPGLRGDIRIGMKNIDGGSGILAYNSFPGSGTGGDMVLDSSENWANSSGTYIFLRNIVQHENGHGLGFAHVCPSNQTKLMEPFYSSNYDGVRQDDLRAVHQNYGDPNESNNSSGTATDLGTLGAGTTTSLGAIPIPSIPGGALLSLHSADVDYYKVTLTEPRLVNITVTPAGTSYTDVDQNGDGSCQSSGTTTNALATADMVLRAFSSNGTTELRLRDATAAGAAETITGLLLSNGVSFVSVSPDPVNTQTQCYTFSITVTTTNLACSATDGTLSDRVRITWPSVPDSTGYIVMRNTVNQTSGSTQVGQVDSATTTFDDLTAAPGTTYYYFVRAAQTGSTIYRYMTITGNAGFVGAANQPPSANAGADIVLQDADDNQVEGTTLDGSASMDADGTIVNYLWQENGMTLGTGPLPTLFQNFTAGVHTVTLTVTDNSNATDSDDVLVTVNRRPLANAGADAVVDDIGDTGSEPVTLDGSASTDPDGTVVNYLWQENGSTLADGPDATPTVDLAWGAHLITLTVTDNLGGVHTDSLAVFVNRVPVANAGPDQLVLDADASGSEMVTLDASASTDADGTITNYLWQDGASTLATGPSAQATVDLGVGVHVITLTVTDNRGSQSSDVVIVTVESPGSPCDPDFNGDGNVDQDDVACLSQVVAGDPSCSGADPDFNRDGNVDQDDIASLTQVVAGEPCP